MSFFCYHEWGSYDVGGTYDVTRRDSTNEGSGEFDLVIAITVCITGCLRYNWKRIDITENGYISIKLPSFGIYGPIFS